MDQKEPLTHSILRNSQVKKKLSESMHDNNPCQGQINTKQTHLNDKYHFNYSQSNPIESSSQSFKFQSKYQPISTKNFIIQAKPQKEKYVVCTSSPRTKPKYSFTFGEKASISNFFNNKSTLQNSNNIRLTDVANNQAIKIDKRSSPEHNLQIRKDMDCCLYNISDKLKQLKREKQNFNADASFPPSQGKYRPSLVQIRKNNKLFLDSTIHRIQPELINKYIQTIYTEYDIPDPLKQVDSQPSELNRINKINIIESNPQLNQRKYQLNIPKYNENHRRKPSFSHTENVQKQYQREQLKNVGLRINNHISNNKEISQKSKKYLKITLSKDKQPASKIITSPKKDQKKDQNELQKSRSKSVSRKGESEKKILNLKNKISNWKQNEHTFIERSSFLQTPYQLLKSNNKQLQKRYQTESNYHIDTKRSQINIKVRPFEELMKVTIPQQSPEYDKQRINLSTINKNMAASQFMESKYLKSFVTQTGQIIEEFRYCLLCELPILSANIHKHEQKCIGWIHNEKLYTFKDLYLIQKDDELKKLMWSKITEIKVKIAEMIKYIKSKQSQDSNYRSEPNKNIVQSIKNYIQIYENQQQTSSQDWTMEEKLKKGFKSIQQNIKNKYWVLVEESSKLHWFIKLYQSYDIRIKQLNPTSKKMSRKGNFDSTRQKNNASQTFIEERANQQISSCYCSNVK